MATYTENYNLTLPEEEDYYDVSVFNENTETIDTLLAENAQSIDSVGDKVDTAAGQIIDSVETNTGAISQSIGTSADNGSSTVFGLLNNVNTAVEGIKFVKSIQYVVLEPAKVSETTVSIKTVNASKCFVIFERLMDTTGNVHSYVKYTLSNSSLTVGHNTNGNNYLKFGFWIIELY